MEQGELTRLVQIKLQAIKYNFRCSFIPRLFKLIGPGRFYKNEHGLELYPSNLLS